MQTKTSPNNKTSQKQIQANDPAAIFNESTPGFYKLSIKYSDTFLIRCTLSTPLTL